MRNLKKHLHSLAYLFTLTAAAVGCADSTTIYHSQDEKSAQEASGYVKTAQSLVRYPRIAMCPFSSVNMSKASRLWIMVRGREFRHNSFKS